MLEQEDIITDLFIKTVAHQLGGHFKTAGPRFFHPFQSSGFTEMPKSWNLHLQIIGLLIYCDILETLEPIIPYFTCAHTPLPKTDSREGHVNSVQISFRTPSADFI